MFSVASDFTDIIIGHHLYTNENYEYNSTIHKTPHPSQNERHLSESQSRAQNQNAEPNTPRPRKVALGARCGCITVEEVLPRSNGRGRRNERGLRGAHAEEYHTCDARGIVRDIGVFSAKHGELLIRVDRDGARRV